jgi:hypothetical protein
MLTADTNACNQSISQARPRETKNFSRHDPDQLQSLRLGTRVVMQKNRELSSLANLVITLTLLLLVALGLPSLDFFGQAMRYLPIHGSTEVLSVAAMFALVAVYLRHRHHPQAGKLAVLAAGCLTVGLIDLLHTLSYENMPVLITPSNPQKAINFWLAGRLAMALTLIGVALTPPSTMPTGRVLGLFAAGLGVVVAVFWVGIFHEASLPATFIEGQGLTAAKIGAEIAIALLFALAAWWFWRVEPSSGPESINWRMISASAWIFGLTEIYLCMYSDVRDIFNMAGHMYKVIAAVLLFLAVRPVLGAPLAAGKPSGNEV